ATQQAICHGRGDRRVDCLSGERGRDFDQRCRTAGGWRLDRALKEPSIPPNSLVPAQAGIQCYEHAVQLWLLPARGRAELLIRACQRPRARKMESNSFCHRSALATTSAGLRILIASRSTAEACFVCVTMKCRSCRIACASLIA